MKETANTIRKKRKRAKAKLGTTRTTNRTTTRTMTMRTPRTATTRTTRTTSTTRTTRNSKDDDADEDDEHDEVDEDQEDELKRPIAKRMRDHTPNTACDAHGNGTLETTIRRYTSPHPCAGCPDGPVGCGCCATGELLASVPSGGECS